MHSHILIALAVMALILMTKRCCQRKEGIFFGSSGVSESDGVTVYVDKDFGGKSWTFAPGSYSTIGDDHQDEISSIKVPRGFRVCAHTDVDFKGKKKCWNGDVKNLERSNWHDSISSLVVSKYDAPLSSDSILKSGESSQWQDYATVYSLPNYMGQSYKYKYENANTLGWPIKSIKVAYGTTLCAYSKPYLKGRKKCYNVSIPDTGSDWIKSLQVRKSAS